MLSRFQERAPASESFKKVGIQNISKTAKYIERCNQIKNQKANVKVPHTHIHLFTGNELRNVPSRPASNRTTASHCDE